MNRSNLMCYKTNDNKQEFCEFYDRVHNHCQFCSKDDLSSNSKLKTCTQNFYRKYFLAYHEDFALKSGSVEGVPIFYKYDNEYEIVGQLTEVQTTKTEIAFTCCLKLKQGLEIKTVEKVMSIGRLRPIIGYKSDNPSEYRILSCYLN